MERITYPDAATIIGVTVGSLKHAVSRGDLTRAGRKGHNQCLVREQVMLFKGRRISYKSLNEADKVIWQRYASEVNNSVVSSQNAFNEEEIKRIAEQAARQAVNEENRTSDFIEAMEAAAAWVRSLNPKREFVHKYPFLSKIINGILIAEAFAPLVALYMTLNEQEKREVRAYMDLTDAMLESCEDRIHPPIEIEEARRRRKNIARFKQEIDVAKHG